MIQVPQSPGMAAALRRMEAASRKWNKAADQLERSKLEESMLRDAAQKAVDEIAPLVRSAIIANFNASDFARGNPKSDYQHTNKIRDAIYAVRVGGTFKAGKAWKIWYLLPAKMPNYVHTSKSGKITQAPFYTVFGALNYGAVIPPANQKYSTSKGKKAKLKAKAQGLGVNKIQGRVTYKNIPKGDPHRTATVSYTVIPAKNFFYLTPIQKQTILTKFLERFSYYLERIFNI